MDMFERLISVWIKNKQIPGAVVDVRMGDRRHIRFSGGHLFSDKASQPMTMSTVFDAASLTKVVVTLPSIVQLAQSGKLLLSDPIQKYVPKFRHDRVTIRHCLQHTSGLPADVPGYRNRHATGDLLREIVEQPLEFEPGRRVLYSDPGMILLGVIVSLVADQPLQDYAREHIFTPMGMHNSSFNPPESWKDRIAPTEWSETGYLHGVVHDEKAHRLGGASGSAGLFTSAEDLSRYALGWLYPERYPLLSPEWVKKCFEAPIEQRGWGWQVWQGQEEILSCGKNWSIGSFGHTGFTGCSLWIDPVRELTVVFMTNAVHLGRDNAIRQLRPQLHDAVLSAISEQSSNE
jgi:CubicO group peptidase (beta-lactamase class C family)